MKTETGAIPSVSVAPSTYADDITCAWALLYSRADSTLCIPMTTTAVQALPGNLDCHHLLSHAKLS